jgi:hypothetical protein
MNIYIYITLENCLQEVFLLCLCYLGSLTTIITKCKINVGKQQKGGAAKAASPGTQKTVK